MGLIELLGGALAFFFLLFVNSEHKNKKLKKEKDEIKLEKDIAVHKAELHENEQEVSNSISNNDVIDSLRQGKF